jgi:UDP-glucose 4-epimerase
VRDYIHVEDLARAHLRALELLARKPFSALNLGTGQGHSVREILQVAQAVTGKPLRIEQGLRRQGDPSVLVASPDLFRSTLGWKPICSDIIEIMESAYTWHSKYNMETKA